MNSMFVTGSIARISVPSGGTHSTSREFFSLGDPESAFKLRDAMLTNKVLLGF